MKKHVQTVHGKEFSCSDCGKTFSCKEKLEVHAVLHQGQHKCDQCPEVFRTVWAKYKHKVKKHNQIVKHKESIKAEKSDHKGHYNEHVRMHSRSPKKKKVTKRKVLKRAK